MKLFFAKFKFIQMLDASIRYDLLIDLFWRYLMCEMDELH